MKIIKPLTKLCLNDTILFYIPGVWQVIPVRGWQWWEQQPVFLSTAEFWLKLYSLTPKGSCWHRWLSACLPCILAKHIDVSTKINLVLIKYFCPMQKSMFSGKQTKTLFLRTSSHVTPEGPAWPQLAPVGVGKAVSLLTLWRVFPAPALGPRTLTVAGTWWRRSAQAWRRAWAWRSGSRTPPAAP